MSREGCREQSQNGKNKSENEKKNASRRADIFPLTEVDDPGPKPLSCDGRETLRLRRHLLVEKNPHDADQKKDGSVGAGEAECWREAARGFVNLGREDKDPGRDTDQRRDLERLNAANKQNQNRGEQGRA